MSVSPRRLTLTDRGSGLHSGVNVERVMCDDDDEHYPYRITVDGTGIDETLFYDDEVPTGEVKLDWIEAVKDRWGEEIIDAIKEDIEVDKRWKNQDSTSETGAIPLPPAQPEAQEDSEKGETK